VDCGLLLVDRHTGELERIARTGQYRVDVTTTLSVDGPGLVPKAIREGNTVYSSDVKQDTHYVPNVLSTRSEMVVPLRTPNGIIGALDLQSSAPDNFGQADMRVLEAFAERAASALELVRLYEEINNYAGQLELRVAERTRELQKAKDRVEAILNNSSDAIILAWADSTIQQTNPRFNELFGYQIDEPFGKLLEDIMAVENEENSLAQVLEEIPRARGYRRLEVLAQRTDGTAFPADAAFATFAVDDTVGIVCSLRDITAQKQLESELRTAFERQKQLADLKTRFVSMVSHEYRNPLAAILSSSSLLEKFSDRLSEDRKQGHLQKIGTQVKRLTELLDDVLEINKGETIGLDFRPELIDLVALCEETIEEMRQISPQHHIQIEISGDPVSIPADVKLMRRILTNLLSNAVKYSPPDSTVTIALAYEGERVNLRVIDQGMGLPEDDLRQLFTVFHRAANVGSIQGTGLGLSIVKQAVEVHGGEITVESTVGEGTTFKIRLPMEIA
jgi:PAS domain S-box-containing protein